jgi:hypothetical protein
LIARRYPVQPIMSYIPALSWSGSLRLARMSGDEQYGTKAIDEMTPFLTGVTPAIAEPYLLTSLAGHLALADWGTLRGNADAAGWRRRPPSSSCHRHTELVRFARAWTGDMFMATSVLARVAKDRRRATQRRRRLLTYAADLSGPTACSSTPGKGRWGRGNGFAAFGLIEASHLPARGPSGRSCSAATRRSSGAWRRGRRRTACGGRWWTSPAATAS